MLALQDDHSNLVDPLVSLSELKAGLPLLIPDGYWDNSHFGAGLTPLADSSLLVYKVVENHPLGLQPGDIVLGYDGIPWKNLYKQLLELQLPVATHYSTLQNERTRGTTDASETHLWLSRSAAR